ncbi:MAG: phage holin family protein [Corynebacteriales bacterium]|nr:phage holin family protein [Mycobacteriales bacterium]
MAIHAEPTTSGPAPERSTVDLVRQVSEQIPRLVRDEISLARLEMAEKGKRAGQGAGLFGGAGLFALYGLGILLIAAVIALDLVMPAWLAALIVAVALFVVAGIMALVGRNRVQHALPPKPEHTVDRLKADVRAISEGVRR